VRWGTTPASVACTRHRTRAMVFSAPDTDVITNRRTPVRTERRWPTSLSRSTAEESAQRHGNWHGSSASASVPVGPPGGQRLQGPLLIPGTGSYRTVAACAGRHAIEAVDQAGDGPLWARSSLAGGRARISLELPQFSPESAQVSRKIFYVRQVSVRERLVTKTRWTCRRKTPCQVTLMPLLQREIRI
jgi:hypothetical protein